MVIYKEVRDFVNNITSISISHLREGYKKKRQGELIFMFRRYSKYERLFMVNDTGKYGM